MAIQTIGNHVSKWGEGPIWHQQSLYYVDIEGHKILRYTPATKEQKIWEVGERIGTIVPRAQGGWVIAGDHGISFFDEITGDKKPLVNPEEALNTRFNDGKCDAAGRFWAGTIDLSSPRQPIASLYCLETDLTIHKKFSGVSNSNGLVWTRDQQTLYYIDTPRKNVIAFDYDLNTGAISHERVAFETQHLSGNPDGMTIDDQDRLWIAFCRGGAVRCIDPSNGEVQQEIEFPNDANVTACAFGGQDLGDLYITSGEHLYVTRPGAIGVPANCFAG